MKPELFCLSVFLFFSVADVLQLVGYPSFYPYILFSNVLLVFSVLIILGTTIIMVTHEHDLVHKFNKRVITIDKGEVIADAPEKESV